MSRRTGVVRALQPLVKSPDDPALPYLQVAELSNFLYLGRESPPQHAGGKGWTVAEAQRSALGEAIEWYSGGNWWSDEVVYAQRAELDGPSLDPRELVLYAPHQYHGLPYAAYDESNVLGWIRGRSLVTDDTVSIPALAGLLQYRPRSPEEFICPSTSSGMAAGGTLADAILRAMLEVLERDAFMIAWLRRLPCEAFDPIGHPEIEVAETVLAYRRRQVEIRLFRLPTDHPVTVLAALGLNASDTDGPAAVVGLGADLDPTVAARKSILEFAQVHAGVVQRLKQQGARERMNDLARDPTQVGGLDDHQLLYAHPRALDRLDFLLDRKVRPWDLARGESGSTQDQLRLLVDHFRDRGQDVIYLNLTPEDMERLDLHTARVIIPGFQPIHFGAKEPRLGGRRLYEFARTGVGPLHAEAVKLNPDPHPLG